MSRIRLPQSLRFRMMAFTGAIFMILAAVIVLSILFFVFTTEKEASLARQREAAHYASQQVDEYIGENENVLEWLDRYWFNERKENSKTLQAVFEDHPAFMEIVFLDTNGDIVLNAAQNQPILANQFTIPQSQWFLDASAGEKTYGKVQTSPNDQSYVVFSMPSQRDGVVAAQIQMDELWKTVSKIHFGESGSVFVIDGAGRVIAHSDPQIVLSNRSLSDAAQLQAILEAPNHDWYGDAVNFDGERVVSVSTAVESTDWIVITELSQREAYASSLMAVTIIPAGILLLMVIAILVFRKTLVYLVIQPINLLRSGSQQLGQGNLFYRINIPRMDELGEAMAVFNSMAEDLEKQHNALRDQAEELEIRVIDRTTALSRVNENLLTEVHERKAAEEQARASLQEKEVLLKEIHHRVKNNLQIITSLLNLQTDQVKDTGTLRALRDSQARVRSMALIHEKLYQSKSLAKIDFGEYVQSLVNDLFHSYQRSLGVIELDVQVDEVALDLDYAVPCGLILNELITNALKYAFPNGRKGVLHIELRTDLNQTLRLRVVDDGVGLPADLDVFTTKSLGLQLVNSLVAQIGGNLAVESRDGTSFVVSFTH